MQTTFSRIVNDLASKAVVFESLLKVNADLQRVIISFTALMTDSRLIPRPFFHCDDMMTHSDRNDSFRHERCKEPLLPLGEILNGDNARLTT
ncbi:MAG: hypothetical protein ACOYXY_02330 [Thermodesulfobacteriota bacterium]